MNDFIWKTCNFIRGCFGLTFKAINVKKFNKITAVEDKIENTVLLKCVETSNHESSFRYFRIVAKICSPRTSKQARLQCRQTYKNTPANVESYMSIRRHLFGLQLGTLILLCFASLQPQLHSVEKRGLTGWRTLVLVPLFSQTRGLLSKLAKAIGKFHNGASTLATQLWTRDCEPELKGPRGQLVSTSEFV